MRLLLAILLLLTSPALAYKTEVVASGLEHPWAVAFLPSDKYLVTERPGRLRVVTADGTLSPPIAGVPDVVADGQGGLLDLVLAPDFAKSRRIYFTFSEPREEGKASLALARATLNDTELKNVEVIFRQRPAVAGGNHFGSRIVFAPDGTLFLGMGERFDYKDQAQRLDSHLGKIVHLTPDGKAAPGNPFMNTVAFPEIWSYGHRNIQAMAFDGEGRLIAIEHGARGGDELNIIKPGANYGWPVITYSRDYITGLPLGEGTERKDITQPVKQWTPSFAPSGLAYYGGGRFLEWKDSLFVGALAHRHLKRLVLKDGKVVSEEILLADLKQRIRDVRQGADGLIYVLTDEADGRLIRLAP